MRELSERAQQLLDLARGEDEPQAGAQARIEQALAARLASGAGPIRSEAIAAKSAAIGTRAMTLTAFKAMLVGVGIVVLAVGAWQVTGSHQAPEQSSVRTNANETAQVRGGVVGPAPVERAAAPAPLPVAVTSGRAAALRAQRAPIVQGPQLAAHSAASSTPEKPAAELPLQRTQEQLGATASGEKAGSAGSLQSATDPLQAETQALRTAQHLLRNGNTQQALALLAQQDLAYPSGALQEERAAARVLALCEGGQTTQAHSEAERFAQRWPRSALLARVISACRQP